MRKLMYIRIKSQFFVNNYDEETIMFQRNQELKVGIVTVTARGLLFSHIYYSSPLLIENQ